MKVENLISSSGRSVPNQFILSDEGHGALGNFISREVFQSYKRVIVERVVWPDETRITLDEHYWDYSITTGKYRNMFLGETKKETQQKIDDGVYTLSNLN